MENVSKKIDEEHKDIKAQIRKCYGAYSSLQSQLHQINGTIEEIRILLTDVSSCFAELFDEWKKVTEDIKK
ncbi:hypothetical protein LCGC14_0225280 [marine sediment metagenome]|uniref:Uncharacterized protein n=1 Tax=marine sediment metagenome TaxID=412755 RepID=A0A0F9UH12_9ZZZZ